MSDCALNAKPNELGSCLPKESIKEIVHKGDGNTLEEVKKNTNCTTDICLLDNVEIDTQKKEKLKRIFLKAPTASFDHNHWLNNTEVDTIMSQFRVKFPGFAHGFIHMIDLKSFEPSNISSFDYDVLPIDKINLPKEIKAGLVKSGRIQGPFDYTPRISTFQNVPLSSYGIICNTDSSSGSGKHWFAIFISTDQRDPDNASKPLIQIELFNSAGGGSSNESFDNYWINKAADISRETGLKCCFKPITSLQHQRSDTGNCGSYSLFYIYARLKGAHPNEFDNPSKPISDHKMKQFRTVCFCLNDNDVFSVK